MKFEKSTMGQGRILKINTSSILPRHILGDMGLYLPIIGLLLYYSATSLGLGVVPVMLSFFGRNVLLDPV